LRTETVLQEEATANTMSWLSMGTASREEPEQELIACPMDMPEKFYAAAIFHSNQPKGAKKVSEETSVLVRPPMPMTVVAEHNG
jgi:hypothetical protein